MADKEPVKLQAETRDLMMNALTRNLILEKQNKLFRSLLLEWADELKETIDAYQRVVEALEQEPP